MVTVATVNDAPANPDGSSEQWLRARVDQLAAENRVLELKVQKLQRMPKDDKQGVFFEEVVQRRTDVAAAVMPGKNNAKGAARGPKGPQPLDPALPREVIQVPAPDLKKLICPGDQAADAARLR